MTGFLNVTHILLPLGLGETKSVRRLHLILWDKALKAYKPNIFLMSGCGSAVGGCCNAVLDAKLKSFLSLSASMLFESTCQTHTDELANQCLRCVSTLVSNDGNAFN